MQHMHILGVVRNVFWNTTSAHLIKVQISLPCGGHASIGANEFRAQQDVNETRAEACVVLHLTVVESCGANLDTSCHTDGGTTYMKDAHGQRQSAVARNTKLSLFNGAKLLRAAEVAHFSSMHFGCDTADTVDVRLGLQHALQVVSAHNVRPREALMLQVVRDKHVRGSLTCARSLAADAVQLLVVLTTEVVSIVPQQGTPAQISRRQPSTVTGWILHVHCCRPDTDIFFGVCPLLDNYVITTELACAFLTQLDGVVCVARTYVAITESCRWHSVCHPEQMRTVLQSGVALMIRMVQNFCPPGMHPIDVSLADATNLNCEADLPVTAGDAAQSIFPAWRLLQTHPVSAPARRLLVTIPAAQPYLAAIYLPMASNLAQIDLGDVLYWSNNAHTDNW